MGVARSRLSSPHRHTSPNQCYGTPPSASALGTGSTRRCAGTGSAIGTSSGVPPAAFGCHFLLRRREFRDVPFDQVDAPVAVEWDVADRDAAVDPLGDQPTCGAVRQLVAGELVLGAGAGRGAPRGGGSSARQLATRGYALRRN